MKTVRSQIPLIAILSLAAIFALVLILPLQASADNFSSMHLSSDDGLSQNNVKSIVQDKYGFMWFGTKNGLNRYDGHRIVQFTVKDPTLGCANQNVSALFASKDGRLWVGTDEGVYTYDSSTNVFARVNGKAADGMQMSGWVSCICQAPNGTMWFCIGGQGIFSLDGDRLTHYLSPSTEGKGGLYSNDRAPVFMTCCTDGSVWACTWNNGLFRFDEQGGRFVNIRQDARGATLCDLQANTISQQDGDLVIGAQNGRVVRYNMRSGVAQPVGTCDFSRDIVRNAMVYGDEIWVGTHNGLYIVNEKAGTTQHIFQHEVGSRWRSGMGVSSTPFRGGFVSDNIIYCTYRDRDGGTWVGTMFGGVNYLTLRSQAFTGIFSDAEGHAIEGRIIRSIIEDGDHRLWVSSEDGGVTVFDLSTQNISSVARFSTDEGVPLALTSTPQGIACTLHKNKVTFFDPKRPAKRTDLSTLDAYGLQGTNSIYQITYESNGRCWLATDIGAYSIEKGQKQARLVEGIGSNWIYDIAVDPSGNVWFASMGSGVYRRDGSSGKIQHFVHDEAKPNSLSSNSVSSITIDHNGTAWFSTDRGGICRYNQKTGDFTRYSIDEGLPDNVAYKIVEDNDGVLWFGTNRGLVRLNPAVDSSTKADIRIFTTRDGLPSNQFNYNGALLASDGRIYMATTGGLLAFTPTQSSQSGRGGQRAEGSAGIFFTNLSIGGVPVLPAEKGSILKNSIMETERIVLPYDKTNITLDLSVFDYVAGHTNNYEYMLLPIDSEWRAAGPTSQITFASLAPGTYTLRIRALQSTTSDTYLERTLTIVVRPPWWRSSVAIVLYVLALVALCTFLFRRYRSRKEREFQERQKVFAIEKERELYKNKVDFFTQVAHEVRTPLTLINGPVEIIRGMNVKDPNLKKNLGVIEQNTQRLLKLTSQLLDFHKVGADHVRLSIERVNLTDLIHETVERFEPAFAVAGKRLVIGTMDEDVEAMVDREAITKILSNLFNNARKYSAQVTTVSIRRLASTPASSEDAERAQSEVPRGVIAVVSDGPRIPADKAEVIFQPFVRLSPSTDQTATTPPQPGTGIGLSLARTLAQMHSGQLALDTTDASGNAFVLTLPLEASLLPNQELANLSREATASPDQPLSQAPHFTEENTCGKSILVVEDEEGIRSFMAEQLAQDFVTATAENGQQALEILQQDHIDLVISDIMMPVMDGLELCRRIKADERLSHTPVVFLTAKNDVDAKIEGLKAGAEAYIEKPFSLDYLRMQITSLLDNRAKEREAFSKRPFFPIDNMKMSREDEEMMQKVLDIINDNLRDEQFNVERLADEMCMSRSSLLRKIKQLFNMPPLEFIRLVRLKRAAELIQEGKYRIGEIGYMVGFGNPSYFAKMFCRQFGMTPKDFEQQLRNERKGE